MKHEYSILYGPVNAIAEKFGLHVPDHVIMALFVLLLSLIITLYDRYRPIYLIRFFGDYY